MTEQFLGWFKSVDFPGFTALGILVFLVLIVALVAGRKAGSRRSWQRLVRVIDGEIKTEKKIRTLTGRYHGHPVIARVSDGAGEAPAPFFVVVPAGPGGQDWEIAHRSEKLLGPETWRAFSKDPALHERLEGARIPERLQGWPKSTTIRYEARRGTLSLGEDLSKTSAEHFRAQLDVLEAMLEVNREMNAA
jgi:hypothetical protein